MKSRKTTLALALMATALGGMSLSAQQDTTAQRRRQLEERRRQLAEEMRDIERELGRDRRANVFSFSTGDAFPRVLTLSSSRAQLGVFVQTRSDGETDQTGAVLESVTPGGPAEEAGLRAGDIVTSFNGKPLAGGHAEAGPDESGPAMRLIELVRETDEGDDVVIEYLRDGQANRTTATVRKLDGPTSLFRLRSGDGPVNWNFRMDSLPMVSTGPRANVQVWPEGVEGLITAYVSGVWANMELVSLNEQLGSYFGTSEGLLVINAPEEEGFDLRGGDIILSIDGREPRSPSRALRILRSYESGETMSVEIMRNRQRMTITYEVPDNRWSGLVRRRSRMQ